MARDLDGLLANPMFMAGLGLLGSNQWSGAATGLLAAQQGRQALAQSQREQQLYDLKMQEYQAKQQAEAEKKAALQQLIQQRPDLGPLAAAGIDVSSLLKPKGPTTLAPGAVMVGPDGKVIAQNPGNDLTFDQKMALAQARGGAGAAGYFTPQATEAGIGSFNNRTGELQIIRGPDGQPIMPAQYSAPVQREIAGAKEAGKVTAGAQAQAQVDAPQAVATADEMLANLNNLKNHPGKAVSVGATGWVPALPGTPMADFARRLEQVQGGAFLQAFETLKGGGQITETEGAKATAAITRMSRSQSDREFDAAVDEFAAIVQAARTRALAKARGASMNEPRPGAVPAATGPIKFLGIE